MDENQQELRHAATEAFMESLNQLSRSLQPDEENAPHPTQKISQPLTQELSNQKPSNTPEQSTLPSCETRPTDFSTDMNINALEEAAADIEQFMQTRNL